MVQPTHNTPPTADSEYPLRADNQFSCLRDGVEFYPRMLDAIATAREFVALEMYLVEPGRVLDRFLGVLLDAAARGVRIYLLLDDFGSYEVPRAVRRQLHSAGVRVCLFNRLRIFKFSLNLVRDHRKLLLIDGHSAFVGGAGIADCFDDGVNSWRENMVLVEGPCVRDWQTMFASTWDLWSRDALELPGEVSTGTGSRRGRVVGGLTMGSRSMRRELVARVRKATRRIWVASAYFLPPWQLSAALRQAAQDGVDVRLLLPGEQTDHPAVRSATRRQYQPWLRAGIRIFEYSPRFMHAKWVICDDVASLGSCNFDRWGLRWNLEANQEISDSAFVRQLGELFAADLSESSEIAYEASPKRSIWNWINERFWAWSETWLLQRSYRAQLRLAARFKQRSASSR